ncbi:hypothetical protein BC669P3_00009 [Bacteroides phage BC669P3]|nr:hypothetical protein BC669P3_00009 [Bacteroides phage BC669P3]
MGCISKLNKAILVDCDAGATGIEELLLINYSEIAAKGITAGQAGLSLLSGGAAILVESNKKGVNASSEARVNDNAPAALADSVTFTIYGKDENSADIVNRILNGRFVAVAKMKEKNIYRVYGLVYGLNMSAYTEEANANGGFTTITLSTPENVIGEQRAHFDPTMYTTLRTGAIVA